MSHPSNEPLPNRVIDAHCRYSTVRFTTLYMYTTLNSYKKACIFWCLCSSIRLSLIIQAAFCASCGSCASLMSWILLDAYTLLEWSFVPRSFESNSHEPSTWPIEQCILKNANRFTLIPLSACPYSILNRFISTKSVINCCKSINITIIQTRVIYSQDCVTMDTIHKSIEVRWFIRA